MPVVVVTCDECGHIDMFYPVVLAPSLRLLTMRLQILTGRPVPNTEHVATPHRDRHQPAEPGQGREQGGRNQAGSVTRWSPCDQSSTIPRGQEVGHAR